MGELNCTINLASNSGTPPSQILISNQKLCEPAAGLQIPGLREGCCLQGFAALQEPCLQQQHWPALAAPSSFSWQPGEVRKVLKDRLNSFASSKWLIQAAAALCALLPSRRMGYLQSHLEQLLSSQNLATRFLLCWQLMGAAEAGLSTQHSLESPFKAGREMLPYIWDGLLCLFLIPEIRNVLIIWLSQVTEQSCSHKSCKSTENSSLDFLGVYLQKNPLNI